MNTSILKWSSTALLLATLLGCGGGGGGGSPPPSGSSPPPMIPPDPPPTDPPPTDPPPTDPPPTDPPPPGTRSVSVTVTGLSGSNSVVLSNNGGNDRTANSNSLFVLGNFPIGSSYEVTVRTHPSYPAANCTVTGGGPGTIADADISSIAVNCTTLPQITSLQADTSVVFARSVTPNWQPPPASNPAATEFNLYVSPVSTCNFRSTFIDCGEKVQAVVPGNTITQFAGERLKNGQTYFLQLETVFANGAKSLSNRASARPNPLAFSGPVRAITVAANGTQYVGGDFLRVGVTTGSAVPIDLTTGRLAATDFAAVAGVVNAVEPDSDGGFFIGGVFTHVGGVPRQNLARIRADGSVVAAFQQFPSGPVHALKVVQRINGRVLYVGGAFSEISPADFPPNPPVRKNLAAIVYTGPTGAGTLVDWHPNPNAAVRALAVLDNSLFVGGDFTAQEGGNGQFERIVDYSIDAATGLPPSDVPNFAHFSNVFIDGPVLALAAFGDSTLYMGGTFAAPRARVARLDFAAGAAGAAGAETFSAAFRPDPDGPVNALAVSNNGSTVYIGGNFATVRTSTNSRLDRSSLAAVAAEDGAISLWDPEPLAAGGPTVHSIHVSLGDVTVYVGGKFTAIGHPIEPRTNVAALNAVNGRPLPGFHPDPGGGGGEVRALARSPFGGTLLVAGNFSFLDGVARDRLAAIDRDGSLIPLWNPGASGEVRALLYYNNPFIDQEVVYVGGNFDRIGGQAIRHLAAVGANNAALLGQDVFFGTVDGPVSALALLESAEGLYVGGSFNAIATQPHRNLAKLSLRNGAAFSTFAADPNGPVNALVATTDAVTGGDVVYVGGNFNDILDRETTPDRVNLAKIDADSGIALDGFVANANDVVNTLALSSDRQVLYVGGRFNVLRDIEISNFVGVGLAAIEIDGDLVLTSTGCNACFFPGPDSGEPLALATFFTGLDDTVFAGGSFNNIGGGPSGRFVALEGYAFGSSTGNLRFFPFFPTPNGIASAVAVSGNTVYVGGSFTALGGAVHGSYGAINAVDGRLIQ